MHLVATIVVAAAFLISGISKVRAIRDTHETLRALGLPSWLQRRWVAATYPIGEIALGAGLLVLPAPAWWLCAAAGMALLAILTVLVVRVLRSGDAVSCNCFGSVRAIDGRTVVRNGALLLLSLVTVIGDRCPRPRHGGAGVAARRVVRRERGRGDSRGRDLRRHARAGPPPRR